MKILTSIAVGIISMYLVLFQLDPWLVAQIVDMIGIEKGNIGLAKLIIWIVVIFFTGGITFWISVLLGAFTAAILSSSSSKTRGHGRW